MARVPWHSMVRWSKLLCWPRRCSSLPWKQLSASHLLEKFPFSFPPRAPGQPKIDHLRRLHLGAYPTEECKSCTR